jgi:hypothetical protein
MSVERRTKSKWLFLAVVLLSLISHLGCDAFVEGVDDPVELIPDDELTDELRVDLLVNGVKRNFSLVYGRISTHAGLLSDELVSNPDASNAFGEPVDNGVISLDNEIAGDLHSFMGSLLARSGELIRRLDAIDFTDAERKRGALFAGYFYGGVARYFIAGFGGLNPREGGGVITMDPKKPGPFIGSSEMYDRALAHLDSALTYGTSPERRVTQTIIARIHLLREDFTSAREAAAAGLAPNDDPFVALFIANEPNRFYFESGPERRQWVFDAVYRDFVDADPTEKSRIPLVSSVLSDSSVVYYQNRYTELTSPLPFATWQENELILAEIELRTGSPTSALNRVNTVRASWGIGPLDSIDMALLEEERRKELWGTGIRLLDQRRFDSWHLGPGTWQYFPIPQVERDLNPNL